MRISGSLDGALLEGAVETQPMRKKATVILTMSAAKGKDLKQLDCRILRSFVLASLVLLMTPLIRSFAPLRTTFSPQAGRRTSREIPRPAKRGEGAAKRRVRGRVIIASSVHCAVRGLRMTPALRADVILSRRRAPACSRRCL